MRDQKTRRPTLRRLIPIAFAAGVIALTFSLVGPAHADTWASETWTVSTKDADAKSVGVGLRHYGDGASSILYRADFDPYGEKLTIGDYWPEGKRIMVTFKVYKDSTTNTVVDTDVFFAGTADSPMNLNVGTPDGSGDIPEGRAVSVKVCIAGTNTCSKTYYGRA